MRLRLLVLAILASIGLVAVPTTSAHAADKLWYYSGSTGATYIKAVGGVVTSDLTAASGVAGGDGQTSTNSMAAANVGTLVKVGAVETKAEATNTAAAGASVRSWARLTGVSLLDGLITIDAVTTDITSRALPDGSTGVSGGTQFANIKIVGANVPVNIGHNTAVSVPGVANVTLNWRQHASKDGLTGTLGWALAVQLLKSNSGFDAGTTIALNPVNHYFTEKMPGDGKPSLTGFAYATRIKAQATSSVNVTSDPTAITYTPFAGSNGQRRSNSTARITLPGVAAIGAVETSSTSMSGPGTDAYITNTSEIANVDLLNGLIKADAIKIVASGVKKNGVWTHSETMTAVKLVIAGQAIPVNVGPNTTLDIAGLGKVEINKQQVLASRQANRIDALRITLNTAQAGLPVGAVIELGVAATQIVVS